MNTATTEMVPAAAKADNLPILVWEGVRVVTTETLAKGYDTDAVNIRMNLTNNRKRFEEGVHHFTLTGSNLKNFRLRVNDVYSQISSKARSLTLWTEKGAARMSKIVDTDQAWEFFEKLEDAYFRPRVAPQPTAPEDSSAMIQALKQQNELVNLVLQHSQHQLELTQEMLAAVRETRQLRTELEQLKAHPATTATQPLAQPTSTAGELALERERDQLAAMLGRSKDYATISAVERVIEREFSWHPLRKWCLVHNEEPVYLKKYGCAWPRGAWLKVYGVNLEELFG